MGALEPKPPSGLVFPTLCGGQERSVLAQRRGRLSTLSSRHLPSHTELILRQLSQSKLSLLFIPLSNASALASLVHSSTSIHFSIFSTPSEAFGNANRPAVILYISGLLTACRSFGLVNQIPAGIGTLVRSEIAGLKEHNACTVGSNDAVVRLSVEGRGLECWEVVGQVRASSTGITESASNSSEKHLAHKLQSYFTASLQHILINSSYHQITIAFQYNMHIHVKLNPITEVLTTIDNPNSPYSFFHLHFTYTFF